MKFEKYFFLCNSMSSIQPSLKNKKNSSEILNWVHTTYNVNILKIEYLPKSAPTAANILTLLVWRWELFLMQKYLLFSTYNTNTSIVNKSLYLSSHIIFHRMMYVAVTSHSSNTLRCLFFCSLCLPSRHKYQDAILLLFYAHSQKENNTMKITLTKSNWQKFCYHYEQRANSS